MGCIGEYTVQLLSQPPPSSQTKARKRKRVKMAMWKIGDGRFVAVSKVRAWPGQTQAHYWHLQTLVLRKSAG
jgi:hypothetical protein